MSKNLSSLLVTNKYFLVFLFCTFTSVSQNKYSVLDYWKYYSDAENQLYKQQSKISFKHLSKRKASIQKLNSKADWEARRLFSGMLFIDPLLSFESMLEDTMYDSSLIPFTVAEALPNYDLPDMFAAFAPKKLTLVQYKRKSANKSWLKPLEFVSQRYKSLNNATHFSVIEVDDDTPLEGVLSTFISVF